ncbi:HEAT repeat domain-containing protein [Streptomyces sp. NPDC021622]|uniref:HEAT repeat domain-containing protein n=1 Tax=Streptomyces sp. NPDC021622 TaxID=3155013 RepID=UPI0034077EE0
MFKKRKARLQAELHEDLAAALRDADPEVRGKAAGDTAETAELGWALRELALAMAREQSVDEPFDSLAGAFAVALRRDRAIRERTEAVFAAHLDDPEEFLREWTALTADLGGAPALSEISPDARDDARGRLRQIRDHDWTAQGLAHAGRPDSFAYEVRFGVAVTLACIVVRRAVPLPADEAERLRAAARDALAKALPLAPGGPERTDVLTELAEQPEDESWTDRARCCLLIDEALSLCDDADPDRVALGVEALSAVLLFNGVFRSDRIRETLDRLAAGPSDAVALSELLCCYERLHMDEPLEAPPLPLFLDALRHADARVRSAAAEGLDPMAEGSPSEGDAVDALVDLLEHDADLGVRVSAARTLAGLVCAEERNSWATFDALQRHADSPVPEIRALSLRDALKRGTPDAYDRLLRELEPSDVHWEFLSAYSYAAMRHDFRLSPDIRPRLVERLEHLRSSGWSDRCEDPDAYPDPEDRAEMLDEILRDLRADA